jgi:hypothetical protein
MNALLNDISDPGGSGIRDTQVVVIGFRQQSGGYFA